MYLGGSSLLSRSYNRLKSGEFVGNTLARYVVLGAQMYTADPEDAALFEEGTPERAIFDDCMALMQRDKLGATEAGRGIYEEFMHYEFACDPIQLNVHLKGDALAAEYGGAIDLDRVCGTMAIRLFLDNAPRFLRHYCINVIGGLVRSAAILNNAFLAYAAALYTFCMVLIVWARKKRLFAHSIHALTLCLLSILLNALFTSFGVWCLSRYMFYNLPMLYLCLYLVFHEAAERYLQKRRDALQAAS